METTPTHRRLTADLELLLRESDREDPILPEIRDAAGPRRRSTRRSSPGSSRP
jgi:hypothetical protein